ncbi:fused response regulator/phosphatase [bacterium]|nr:fused response regulator/phosphatase [bacterium]
MSLSAATTARPRVLLVDDEPAYIMMSKDCLESCGYEVVVARNGRDALAALASGNIDLVLCDIIMPVLNGVEVVKTIRNNPSTRDIPVIVISSMTEYKDRVEFFKLGANDYMPKPIDRGELTARVNMQLQLVHLRREVASMNDTLAAKNSALEGHLSRLEGDLRVARAVQRALLPPASSHIGNIDIYFEHNSTDKLGSDFIDYLVDDRGELHMIIADVSGHGTASALIAAQLKVLFHEITQRNLDAKGLVNELNTAAVRTLTRGYYFTASYLRYEPLANVLSIVNGGHTPLLYLDRAGSKIRLVESDNSPLGFFAEERYAEIKFNPGEGDMIVMYTDGLTENRNASNLMFDVQGVIDAVKGFRGSSPRELAGSILRSAESFSGNTVTQFGDDVTICVLGFGPPTGQKLVAQPRQVTVGP